MSDKYIKLEEAMDSLRPYERFEVIQDLIKRIESLPTIEVSEDCISRPRGEWIAEPQNQGGFTPGGNAVKSCSCCGWIYGAHRIVPDYNYCPNCEANMRGEK